MLSSSLGVSGSITKFDGSKGGHLLGIGPKRTQSLRSRPLPSSAPAIPVIADQLFGKWLLLRIYTDQRRLAVIDDQIEALEAPLRGYEK